MLIYAKMAKNDTFLAKKWSKIIFSKNAAQSLQNTLQGMSGPNFSSKASVTFSNSAGMCQKMKCLKTAKTQKIALFDRKIACFNIFVHAMVNILIAIEIYHHRYDI